MNNRKFTTDLDALKAIGYKIRVNDQDYDGHIAVGDTVDVNGVIYGVLGINEDGIVVKELGV